MQLSIVVCWVQRRVVMWVINSVSKKLVASVFMVEVMF
jgi:hypothetical protein